MALLPAAGIGLELVDRGSWPGVPLVFPEGMFIKRQSTVQGLSTKQQETGNEIICLKNKTTRPKESKSLSNLEEVSVCRLSGSSRVSRGAFYTS